MVGMKNPAKVQSWEEKVGIMLSAAWGKPTILHPVMLYCEFVFERPEYLNADSIAPEVHCHSVRPDYDNCLKAPSDALVMGQVIREDCLIFWGCGLKLYAAKGESPHARIALYAPNTRDAVPPGTWGAPVHQQ